MKTSIELRYQSPKRKLSVLGPILALHERYTTRWGKTMATFADDTAILAVGNTINEATMKLKKAVNQLYSISLTWISQTKRILKICQYQLLVKSNNQTVRENSLKIIKIIFLNRYIYIFEFMFDISFTWWLTTVFLLWDFTIVITYE